MVVLNLTYHPAPGPGDTFNLRIVADDATALLNYAIELRYFSGDFEVLGVQSGASPRNAGWGEPAVNLRPDGIILGAVGAAPLFGPATLATITMRVDPNVPLHAIYPFEFITADLNDGAIDAVTQNIELEIIDPSALPVGGWALIAAIALILLFGIGATAKYNSDREEIFG